ncbi:hypothetical protein [Sphingomonas oligophenolica]|nr:hypothetical protein [Sphingomonas oligophenolica]
MAYNFGTERRKGSDRRITRNPAYAGVERRLTQHRERRTEREGPFAWIVLAMIALIVVDTLFWHGFYRHALVRGLNAQAEAVRAWSADLWDWKSTR